jgi:hypothetical protein
LLLAAINEVPLSVAFSELNTHATQLNWSGLMFGRFELKVSKFLVVRHGFMPAGVASNSGWVFSSWAILPKHAVHADA